MIAQELKIGDWFKCEYKGRPRMGCVKKATYPRERIWGPWQDGWLVQTENGLRTYKFTNMRNVELVA